MARIRFIKSPTDNTIKLLAKRMEAEEREEILSKKWGAVGLIQTQLADLFAMADIAEKNTNVLVTEIRGICPQHFSMIAIFGDTASVEAALEAARNFDQKEKNEDV
ncbi:BMC domain-containing protein [Candidatus Poribacteria bacterium]|nr:BMC domain-containing protein [Candidatus Poribacteria bacterium]